MEYYYYKSSNDEDYPLNYTYSHDHQPYYNDYQNYYSPSSSYDHEYGGTATYSYSNGHPIRYEYDHYYYDNYNINTQFQSNPYQLSPSQPLTLYHYNSAYAYDHPLDFPANNGPSFLDSGSTTGFVVSYSTAEPEPDLNFEIIDPEHFQGGYDMTETYGKPLPPSEEICYPPSKFDPTPPPPPSSLGAGEEKIENPLVKEDHIEEEDEASEAEEDEEEEEEEENEEEDEAEEERENENRGILMAPPLPGKEDQIVEGEAKPAEAEEADNEEDSNPEEYEEEEQEEEKRDNWDDGRVEEKGIRRQIPPGYGLEAMDLCEGVFGGYFPCLRKRMNQGSADPGSTAANEDGTGDCWKTTMDYLFGDLDPYARAMPDLVYSYHRYYPQQPLSGQIEYGGDHSSLDNSSYYCGYNGGGYH